MRIAGLTWWDRLHLASLDTITETQITVVDFNLHDMKPDQIAFTVVLRSSCFPTSSWEANKQHDQSYLGIFRKGCCFSTCMRSINIALFVRHCLLYKPQITKWQRISQVQEAENFDVQTGHKWFLHWVFLDTGVVIHTWMETWGYIDHLILTIDWCNLDFFIFRQLINMC